jgi:hypothetical protein
MRIRHDRAGNGDSLLLATREKESTFSHYGIVAKGKLRDETIRIGLDARFFDKP